MPIDLSKLPVPDVIDQTSYETIVAEMVEQLSTAISADADLSGEFDPARLKLASEPLRVLLESFAYREFVLRQRINDAVRGVMLASAKGTDLDNLAALYGIARTTLTDGDAVLSIEGDDSLRYRARDATELLTNAGTASAYGAHANGVAGSYIYRNGANTVTITLGIADQVVEPNAALVVPIIAHDTNVARGVPGEVLIRAIGNWEPNAVFQTVDGATDHADSLLLDLINNEVNKDNVRQVTDKVSVKIGQVLAYQVTATLTIGDGPTSEAVVNAADSSLRNFAQGAYAIDQVVARSGIIASLWQEGVENLSLTVSLEGENAPYLGDLQPDATVDAFFLTDISITTTVV